MLKCREEEIQSWVDLVQANVGSSELGTYEFNFVVTLDETEIDDISPKIGNKNKKR